MNAEYGRGTTPRFYVTPEALGSWADYAQRHVSSDDWEGTLARALLTLVSAYQWARDWPDEQSDGSNPPSASVGGCGRGGEEAVPRFSDPAPACEQIDGTESDG